MVQRRESKSDSEMGPAGNIPLWTQWLERAGGLKIKSETNHWVREKDEAGRKTCRESAFSVTINDRKKIANDKREKPTAHNKKMLF